VASYVEPTAMGRYLGTEGATVRVDSDGTVMAFVGTTAQGHSIETTMAQVVADTLGVAFEHVTVVQADSQATPYGPGTGGSRTAVVVGGAVHDATVAVREGVLAIAAHQMEAAPEDLDIADGQVFVRGSPTRAVSLREVAMAARRFSDSLPPEVPPRLEATVRFRPTRFPTWSNATHVCVVEIDVDTCVSRVVRYIVSEDCGRMINPAVVNGQIYGGVVQGIGGVLLEDFIYDSGGNPLTTTFMDYLLPTTAEVPDIEVGHIECLSTSNPTGAKGVGEGGAIGAHAAVANAVGDALAHLGVQVTATPLGPKEIHRLLQEAGRL
jgi:carbon-monoxide dehydrogenase large subunit